MINYNNKTFALVSTSKNSEISTKAFFHYKQIGQVLSCNYSGGKIRIGHLIGVVDEDGNIEMSYHQVNDQGQLMTGKCISKPEILENGKIRLHEKWEWTSGEKSKGQSILEEQ